jgi:putative transposase
MKRLQAFKYEVMPSCAQRQRMSQFAGCRRVVFNKALEVQSANYAAANKYIRYESLAKYLGIWRSDLSWLGEEPHTTRFNRR